jgi:MFS family permease
MSLSSDRKNGHARLAFGSLALSMLLSAMGVSIPNVALPSLAQAYSAPLSEVQWVVLAYLLAVTTSIVGAGRLGDVIGRRRVLLAGIAIFSLSALLCSIATRLWLLIVARAIQGLGAATLMALTVALVSEVVPKEKLGRAMGILGTMSAVGTAMGPSVGGLLIAWLGWRAVFLAMAVLGMLIFCFIRRYLTDAGPRQFLDFQRFDLPGTLLLGMSLASYALTVTLGGGRLSSVNLGLLLVTGISGSLFAWNEARVPSPLIQWEALRGSDTLANLVMNALVSSIMMATLVVGPFYLSRGLGFNAALVGLVMSVGPVTSSLTGVLAGRSVDRLGASAVTFIGLFELGIGALAMSLLPPILGVAGYIVSALLMSPGYQMFQAANNTSVMSKTGSDQRGVVSGMLSLSRNLGLITGTSVMGAVFSLATRTPQITMASPDAAVHGMRVTFRVATALAILALFMAVRTERRRAVETTRNADFGSATRGKNRLA